MSSRWATLASNVSSAARSPRSDRSPNTAQPRYRSTFPVAGNSTSHRVPHTPAVVHGGVVEHGASCSRPGASPSEPSVTPSSDTTGKVAGSRPETNDVPPLMCTSPCRTCDTRLHALYPAGPRPRRRAEATEGRRGQDEGRPSACASSRPRSVDALAEAPNTATNTTRPSADRQRGGRRRHRADSASSSAPPSLPGTPVFRIGSPMTPAHRARDQRVSIATPTNVSADTQPDELERVPGRAEQPVHQRHRS